MIPKSKPPRDGARYKVIVYLRVSKDDALTGSFTFETQRKRIAEMLDRRYGSGNYLTEELVDDGLSGGYGPEATGVERRTRPSLKTLTQKLQSRAYDCLIVYDLSRFMRSLRWLLQLIEDVILPSGIDFMSATEDIDLSTPEGMAQVQMMGLFNNLQRSVIIKRCKDAAATRAEQGYLVGQPQYGWQWEPQEQVAARGRRGIVRSPAAGEWIMRIKDWYLAGWSTGRIAGELNELGVPSPNGKSLWAQGTVREVLSSPLHAGLVAYGGKHMQGAHYDQRYYDPQVYDALIEARQKRKHWYTATDHITVHLLNEMVFCARCGKRLYTSRAPKEYRSYRCTHGAKQGKRTCREVVVRAIPLERAVEVEIARIAQLPQMQKLLQEEARQAACQEDERLTAEQGQLERALADLADQFKRWAEMVSKGLITQEQFGDYNRDLLADKAQKTTRLAEVSASVAASERREARARRVEQAILDVPRVWRHLDMEERRNVLSLLLERLTVDRHQREVVMRIKLHLLPEQEVRVLIPTGYRRKPEGIGPQTLTARQLVLLHYVGQGQSRAQICEAMGIADNTINFMTLEIRKRMGVHDLAACAAQARSRVQSLLPSLPLGRLQARSADGAIKLSAKLLEVFPLLASGAKLEEVASVTGLPLSTVANRKKQIVKRLEVRTIFEAGQKARAQGLLP